MSTKAAATKAKPTKAVPKSAKKEDNPLTSTYAASAITTDLPNDNPSPKTEFDNSTFANRAANAGVGLIKVEGIDFRYVGKREPNAETPSGYPISTDNSTFTPLADVPFDPSIRVKIGDEYSYPAPEVSSWEGVEGLVPSK